MNLLPENIKRKRAIHAHIISLIPFQIIVFLVIAAVFFIVELDINHAESQVIAVENMLLSERFARSEEMAQYIRGYYAREQILQDAAYMLGLPYFNVDRFNMIYETLPQDVDLISAEIDESGIVLTLRTKDLSLADVHRSTWIDTGLVSRAAMISAIAVEDGNTQYVLIMDWITDYGE